MSIILSRKSFIYIFKTTNRKSNVKLENDTIRKMLRAHHLFDNQINLFLG